jgi:HAMP domain-containing protein
MILAGTSVLAFYGIRASNRFYEPVQRIQNALDALQRGEKPAPIQVRENDGLRDLAKSFNRTFESQLDDLSQSIEKKLTKSTINQSIISALDLDDPEPSKNENSIFRNIAKSAVDKATDQTLNPQSERSPLEDTYIFKKPPVT